jgi:hypothetical protein
MVMRQFLAKTLREKQSAFARLLSLLILEAEAQGFEVTIGEVYRSPEEAERLFKLGKGIKNSLHTLKLAVDINLFKNGIYLSSTDSHRSLGEWWESQSISPDIVCHWGGRFGDGNHYSIGHAGRK